MAIARRASKPREPSSTTEVAPEDGRVRRGQRNRERIVDSILELVREGQVRPTADAVAARAGVGARTVFRHFDDMESLHAELQKRVAAEIRPLLMPRPFVGARGARVQALVALRVEVFERVAPTRRAGRLVWPRTRVMDEGWRTLSGRLREQLEEAFAPELPKLQPDLLEALDEVLSYESWERLHTIQRLGRGRIIRVLEAAAAVLLGASSRSDS